MSGKLDRALKHIRERLEDYVTSPLAYRHELRDLEQWDRTGTLPRTTTYVGIVCAAGQDAGMDHEDVDGLLNGVFNPDAGPKRVGW